MLLFRKQGAEFQLGVNEDIKVAQLAEIDTRTNSDDASPENLTAIQNLEQEAALSDRFIEASQIANDTFSTLNEQTVLDLSSISADKAKDTFANFVEASDAVANSVQFLEEKESLSEQDMIQLAEFKLIDKTVDKIVGEFEEQLGFDRDDVEK